MMRLDVWMSLGDATQLEVGELVFTDSDQNGRYAAAFRYSEAWLNKPGAFALDPESLPLRKAPFEAQNLFPPLAVFDDALPDDWGRRVLIADRKLRRGQHSEPYLLRELAGDGLGALGFCEQGSPAHKIQATRTLDLAEILEAASRFEAGLPIDNVRMRRLLAAGASPGGARPKALVNAGEIAWIAKFPSRTKDGNYDVVGLEATAMLLAQAAGLEVPETRLEILGAKKAVLVRRFDITAQGGRAHMISLRTLCKERPGVFVLSYREVADMLRKHSADPANDVTRFYRQTVFNAMLGNTDDHLKNFWMINVGQGYRLSPAFDLVPDVGERGEHSLAFDLGYTPPDKAAWLNIAKTWGVSGAAAMIEEIAEAMKNFVKLAHQCAVPEQNIVKIKADIEARRQRCLS